MYTIAVDVDGTIAALEQAWLARYNRDYGDNMTREQWIDWNVAQFVKPECGSKIYEYLKDPTLYDEVYPIEGALEGVNKLRDEGHRVIFPTTTPIESSGAKYYWLKHYKFLDKDADYIEVADKGLVLADFLLDDGFHNITAFRGTGILYRQPWNVKFDHPHDALDWNDFLTKWNNNSYVHPTIAQRPSQAMGFLNTVMDMYKVHLDKNADYSPANILGTGEIGLMTRIWDKVARLMNLNGFHIDVNLKEFSKPLNPKNESLDDSLMDLAVYAVIWMLYRRGVWGK